MTEFEKGALVAIGLIVATHDETTIAASVLSAMGLCEADCSEMEDYDKENLAKLQGQCQGRVRLRGLTTQAWRMPERDELRELVVEGKSPSVDARVFPACPSSSFWSASPYAGNSYDAWSVYFNGGYVYYNFRNNYYHVRPVRGGQSFDPSWPALDTEGRWFDCGEGLAFDSATGLQWQRYCLGQSWADGKPVGEPKRLTWDEAMALNTATLELLSKA